MKRKIIFLNLISLLLFITPSIKALDYQINSYDVDIVVNKNNTFDITETISTYFNTYKHGIIRKIPLKNKVERLDGTVTNNRVNISNVSVDNEFSKYKENGYYVLKIDSASETFTGAKRYIIKYNYNIGKDPLKYKDEFYFNIIGTEWDTTISNVTFKITMPESFDSSKIGFSSGRYGDVSNNITYSIDGNVITGKYKSTLGIGEALTLRLELPEGYFVGAGNSYDYLIYLYFIIPIICFLVSLLIWYKYGKDDEIIEPVEFYPPEGLNSLDVGYLYKGKAQDIDVVSLLIYLANKGYIKISNDSSNFDRVDLSEEARVNANKKIIELEKKINDEKISNSDSNKIKYYENMLSIYKNIDKPIDYKALGISTNKKSSNDEDKFTITKLKEYDGNNEYEKIFMKELFSLGNSQNDTVKSSELYNNFYFTVKIILGKINSKINRRKIFENTKWQTLIVNIMLIFTSLFTLITPMLEYSNGEIILIILFVVTVYFPFYMVGFIDTFPKKYLFPWWFTITVSFIIIILFTPIFAIIRENKLFLLAFIINLIFNMVIALFYKNMSKRTKYGIKILGKIEGFKKFLETAEKEKLESMVTNNPKYFYDILPYTYVLGISNKWIKKFETIAMKEPIWFDGNNDFSISSFNSYFNSVMSSSKRVVTSINHSSVSSGGYSSSSSGGGFSGGGSGGGGGSSW